MPTRACASRNVASTTGMPAKPCIMPTDWEPCPGKAIASVMSVAGEDRAPGEAAAHALQEDEVSGPHATIANRHVERERDRGGRGVGVLVHGDDAFRFGKAELLGDVRQ